MKNIILLLTSFLYLACNDIQSTSETDNELFTASFSNYRQVDFLKDYEKISDTSYYKSSYDPTHRIMELKKNGKTLILFLKISLDEDRNENYSILDTLQLGERNQNQVITIGYCEMPNTLMEEIVAVVERTEADTIQKIIKAYKANSETNKIEPIPNLETIQCLNDHKS